MNIRNAYLMKRLLVAMLSVVLVIGMLPGMAFAQETPVAQNTSSV